MRKLITTIVALGVLVGFSACGEGGINDKDKNSTTILDLEDAINNLSDANTSSPDINISDINSSTPDSNISDINISDINSSMPDIGTGHYVDSAVKGVNYDCGNQDGVTDDNGTFTFEKGKECIFSLGDIVLRTLDPSKLEDKMIVIEDNIDNARLLQTLDNDGDASNGIDITKNVLDAISSSGTKIVPVGDDELGSFFQNIEGVEGYEGAMKSLDEAQAHIAQTAKELQPYLDQIPTEDEVEETADSVDNMFDNI